MPGPELFSYSKDTTPVIIELGHAYTKIGFSSDSSPRFILPSLVKDRETGRSVSLFASLDPDQLQVRLFDFLRLIYSRVLCVNSFERRVLVVESLLAPSVVRDCLARVLFQRFDVPALLLAPAHLLALLPLGSSLPPAASTQQLQPAASTASASAYSSTSLVLDVGFEEALVVPVSEGITLVGSLQSASLGMRAALKNLELLIKTRAFVSPSSNAPSDKRQPFASSNVTLEDRVLEDIAVRICFVTSRERAEAFRPLLSTPPGADAGQSCAFTPAPAASYQLDNDRFLEIDGLTREMACETFFELDDDNLSIATLLLDAIFSSPVDLRRPLAESVLLIGGTLLVTGFRARLKQELEALLARGYCGGGRFSDEAVAARSRLSFKFRRPPAEPNYTAWLGGAMLASLEVFPLRALSREQFVGRLPDWQHFLPSAPEPLPPSAGETRRRASLPRLSMARRVTQTAPGSGAPASASGSSRVSLGGRAPPTAALVASRDVQPAGASAAAAGAAAGASSATSRRSGPGDSSGILAFIRGRVNKAKEAEPKAQDPR